MVKFKSLLVALLLVAVTSSAAGARYYDPVVGRFITPDSIVPSAADPQSFNRYSYVRNNPITNIDPTGHSFLDAVGTAATIFSSPSTAIYVGARALNGDIHNFSDAFRYSYQGVAWQMGIGAVIGAGIALAPEFAASKFSVAWAEMGSSAAIAGIGYVLDKNGWDVDTSDYDSAEANRQRYINSRPRNPVTQRVPEFALYAMAGLGDSGRGPIFSPLIGLGPHLQVRAGDRRRRDDDGTELYHYGYLKNAVSFKSIGVQPGGYATRDFYLTGRAAQLFLSLPVHTLDDSPPNTRYIFNVDLAKTPHMYNPSVAPLLDSNGGTIRPGGGTEYMFPLGTGGHSFKGFNMIPPY